MWLVPEEDRKSFLEYLSIKRYIEAAPLITKLAAWKKQKKDKKDNGKDKPN